jgi:hypothetical protein
MMTIDYEKGIVPKQLRNAMTIRDLINELSSEDQDALVLFMYDGKGNIPLALPVESVMWMCVTIRKSKSGLIVDEFIDAEDVTDQNLVVLC